MSENYAEKANKAWQAAVPDLSSEIDEATLFAIINLIEHAHEGQLRILKLDVLLGGGFMCTEIIWRRDSLDKRFVANTTSPAAIPLRRIVPYLLSA